MLIGCVVRSLVEYETIKPDGGKVDELIHWRVMIGMYDGGG